MQNTHEVYSSALNTKYLTEAMSRKSSMTVTKGVNTVRSYKKKQPTWPLVMTRKDFKECYVLPAIKTIKEVSTAAKALENDKWLSAQNIILEAVVNDLVKMGDVLEINGFVVTNFNQFTQEVIGKLFEPSDTKGWGNEEKKDSFVNYAMTADQIEDITNMKQHFGGDKTLLPK